MDMSTAAINTGGYLGIALGALFGFLMVDTMLNCFSFGRKEGHGIGVCALPPTRYFATFRAWFSLGHKG